MPPPPAPYTPIRAALTHPQVSTVTLRIGKRTRFRARVEVTPVGLLAIGGLTAMILLATVPLVRAGRAAAGAPPR